MKKLFCLMAMAAFAAVSCQEKITDGAGGVLSCTLGYDGNDYIEISTKVVDFDLSEMSITIQNAEGEEVYRCEDASTLPAEIELAPGQYTARAYTAGASEAAFDEPSFSGEKQFSILDGEVTEAEIVCSLDNVKVSVLLDESFTSNIKDYSVTVTAVDYEKSLVFTSEYIEQGRAGYFAVSPLQVNVIGKRIENDEPVNLVSDIEDVEARDHFILNISVGEVPSTGGSGSLKVTIDESTNDHDVDITVPGLPDIQEGPAPEIAFSCSEDVTFTTAEAASAVVDITVKAENKVENLFVKIESQELLALLSMLPIGDVVKSGNWDIANISDPSLAEFLSGLGLYNEDDPVKGKTEHTFSIGAFMPLMPASENPYPFVITVTDALGKETTRTLTVHRVD